MHFRSIHSEIKDFGRSGMLLRSGRQPAAWDLQGSARTTARQADGGRPGHSPANSTLLAAFLTSKASPSVQNPGFGVDVTKIHGPFRNQEFGCPGGALAVQKAPLELPSLDLGFLEAVLAADLITA